MSRHRVYWRRDELGRFAPSRHEQLDAEPADTQQRAPSIDAGARSDRQRDPRTTGEQMSDAIRAAAAQLRPRWPG